MSIPEFLNEKSAADAGHNFFYSVEQFICFLICISFRCLCLHTILMAKILAV